MPGVRIRSKRKEYRRNQETIANGEEQLKRLNQSQTVPRISLRTQSRDINLQEFTHKSTPVQERIALIEPWVRTT